MPSLACECRDELLGLWDKTKFTVIFVTHSIPEAIEIGNRILLLSPHPGQVKAEIDSVPRGQDATAGKSGLGRKIHELLFTDKVEDMDHA
jgi:NitT/TauT family transport system ATP-binding protein